MSVPQSGADPRPTLFQVGRVVEISPSRVGKSGSCFVKDIIIEGNESAKVSSSTYYFCFVPRFFARGFHPASLEGAEKMFWDNHINCKKGNETKFDPSIFAWGAVGLAGLQGLATNDEKFNQIYEMAQVAFEENPPETKEDGTEDYGAFAEALDTIFNDNIVGNTVGYVLKQQLEATTEKNERGYPVRIPGKYYQVSGFFYLDKKTEKAIHKAVDKFNEKPMDRDKGWKAFVMFDSTLPFDSTYSTTD